MRPALRPVGKKCSSSVSGDVSAVGASAVGDAGHRLRIGEEFAAATLGAQQNGDSGPLF